MVGMRGNDPPTSSFVDWRSDPIELHTLKMEPAIGFEPMTSTSRGLRSTAELRRSEKIWWLGLDLNQRHQASKTCVLPD